MIYIEVIRDKCIETLGYTPNNKRKNEMNKIIQKNKQNLMNQKKIHDRIINGAPRGIQGLLKLSYFQ